MVTNQDNELPQGFKMTELGPLPEEWKEARLVEITQKKKFAIVDGPFGSQMKVSEFTSTGVPVVEMEQLKNNNFKANFRRFISEHKYNDVKRSTVTAGDLIISKTGTLGLVGIVPSTVDRAVMTSRLAKVSIDANVANNKFIYFTFLFLRNIGFWEGVGEGTTMKVLSIRKIGDAYIPLPSLPEQKAIARVLSTIQKAIEAQDKIAAAAKEMKKSLMRHLFTYGPVPVAEAEQIPLKETEIGPVPEHWEVEKLIDVAINNSDIVGGPFGSNLKVSDYRDSSVPIIRLQNIERNRFINKDIKFISKEKAEELKYHSFSAGDIILAKLGDPIGKTCIVPDELVKGIVVADVVRIRTSPALTYKDYVVYALNTDFCGEQFRSQKTGTTRPRVNVSNVRNILIPIPPIDEQQQIASILSAVDKKIEAEQNHKSALQALFKTMLHLLMTGKVRVKDLEVSTS